MTYKRKQPQVLSNEQAERKKMPKNFDHEFANEPLTANEKHNNKKTKKRQ